MRRSSVLVVAAVLCVAGGSLVGCRRERPVTGTMQISPDRGRRLLSLAAREAAAIKDVDIRLTRQLNLADQQLGRRWLDDAHQTLAEAAASLKSPEADALKDHARLSGWISISQLSRQAGDEGSADRACGEAMVAMRQIEDPARRCEYVMGIANELQYLRGKGEAAKLLAEAGPWTPSIDDVARRRQAVVSFASALFNMDDYPAGQRMLQQEGDAAWRSETLQRLASLAARGPVMAGVRTEATGAASSASPYFGRKLDFKAVFQNQTQSQTVRDEPASRPAIKP